MDRLTKPGGSYCDDCVAFSKPDEFCEEYAACMDEIAMYDRLAAYEDMGLEPEEVKELIVLRKKNTDILCGMKYARFTEILKAESEGRLIVLPSDPCEMADVAQEMLSRACRLQREAEAALGGDEHR